MHNIPEEAVKAAKDVLYYANPNDVERALTAARPFLSGQAAVKKLEWGNARITEDGREAEDAESPVGRYIATDTGWFLLGRTGYEVERGLYQSKAAAQADYEARILSALEPSAARELALEEGYRQGIEAAAQKAAEMLVFADTTSTADREIPAAIRALSSPDHADAGKTAGVKLPSERVCIPDPHNPDARIVGFRIREGDDAWGETGLSEPIFWLNKLLTADAGKVEGDGWLPIDETAKSGRIVRIAYNRDDVTMADAFYRDGKWHAACVFYRSGAGKPPYEFREHKVLESLVFAYRPLPSAPSEGAE